MFAKSHPLFYEKISILEITVKPMKRLSPAGPKPTRLVTAFIATAALGLLTGCNESDDTDYGQEVSAAQSYTVNMGGGELNITEFIPRNNDKLACIHISPRSTWDGTTQACYPKGSEAAIGAASVNSASGYVDSYRMASGSSTLLVTTFSPRLAPDVTCVHSAPQTTWSGTVLSCQ